MPTFKTQAAKNSLLRRVRKQRLKSITILPSLITILNGICGFGSIVLASRGNYEMAGYLIFLAMIADVLDGRLARISRTTSSFGGQLDSLCDIISFGLAPAFLTLQILDVELAGLKEVNLALAESLQRLIWFLAAAYVSCAAIRLARYNVENEEDEASHMSFIGLPTPAAAGVVVSIIIFYQEIFLQMTEKNSFMFMVGKQMITYFLPFVVFGSAILMVSRIRYPHVFNQYIKGKKPLAYLLICLVVIGLIYWFRQVALVAGFCGFASTGFIKWLYNKTRKKAYLSSKQHEPQVGENIET